MALCGYISSLLIQRLPVANPARKIPWNPASQTVQDLAALISNKPLFLAAFGDAYFWTLASILQINIDQFATKHLQVSQTYVGPLLAILAVGMGSGALLAGFLSRGKVELGLVPFDSPEAEQEIMGGIITEYSGPPLAVIELTKTMLLAVLPLFMIGLLMGGIRLEGISILWAVLKYVAIVVLIVLIRNTNPRVRIDQAVSFFWGTLTVLALIGLALAYVGL